MFVARRYEEWEPYSAIRHRVDVPLTCRGLLPNAQAQEGSGGGREEEGRGAVQKSNESAIEWHVALYNFRKPPACDLCVLRVPRFGRGWFRQSFKDNAFDCLTA